MLWAGSYNNNKAKADTGTPSNGVPVSASAPGAKADAGTPCLLNWPPPHTNTNLGQTAYHQGAHPDHQAQCWPYPTPPPSASTGSDDQFMLLPAFMPSCSLLPLLAPACFSCLLLLLAAACFSCLLLLLAAACFCCLLLLASAACCCSLLGEIGIGVGGGGGDGVPVSAFINNNNSNNNNNNKQKITLNLIKTIKTTICDTKHSKNIQIHFNNPFFQKYISFALPGSLWTVFELKKLICLRENLRPMRLH